jgi:hypothetical protein
MQFWNGLLTVQVVLVAWAVPGWLWWMLMQAIPIFKHPSALWSCP